MTEKPHIVSMSLIPFHRLPVESEQDARPWKRAMAQHATTLAGRLARDGAPAASSGRGTVNSQVSASSRDLTL
ncbi:hypothetical protein ACFZAM_04870 [Streptomyces sp. NPDC008079]|uniref:hypothetical protein n=1 Tax=Streptomyces sp. NPDC008079 TaxID=3364806 RepID=UPI0036E23B82